MTRFLFIGIFLGLPAGIAPGPLLALIISETLQHDVKSGIKVAIAPVLTDLPLLLLTFYILSNLSVFHEILGVISLMGGWVVLFMGVQNLLFKGMILHQEMRPPASLLKGMLANILSPHPYLFWFSVGGPIMTRAAAVSETALLCFILGFYTFLVGSKVFIALLVGRSKSLITGKAYIYALRSMGLALCSFSLFLFRDGLKLLGLLE